MEETLLEILCCPVSHQALAPAKAEMLDSVNKSITAGEVKNAAGISVRESLSAALIREDGKMLYPIRHGIPVLLPEEGISR